MTGFKSFIAEELGSVSKIRSSPLLRLRGEICLLEGYSVLGDGFVSRLPDERHIASIGSLEPP